jgi:ferredoxin-NADP reductase
MGDFVLPKDKTIPLIFVAGGLGITPLRSMVKYLTDNQEKRDIQMIYVTSVPEDQVFVPLFKSYVQKLTLLNRQDDQDQATLTAQTIIDLSQPSLRSRIYLSGPEPMIEDLVDQFKKTTIKTDQLVTDYFPGYTPI